MASELPVRGQGYPAILKDQDVNVPLGGPFWTFEPKLTPQILVEDYTFKAGVGPTDNFTTLGQVVSPVAGANLALAGLFTPGFGWWYVRVHAWANNREASPLAGMISVVFALGAVAVQTDLMQVWNTSGAGVELNPVPVQKDFIVKSEAGIMDQVQVKNVLALNVSGASSAYASLRTRFLGKQYDRIKF